MKLDGEERIGAEKKAMGLLRLRRGTEDRRKKNTHKKISVTVSFRFRRYEGGSKVKEGRQGGSNGRVSPYHISVLAVKTPNGEEGGGESPQGEE